jgi:hypothetical protein
MFAAGALAALAALGSWSWTLRHAPRHGVEPRSGFVMAEADRRKSRAYLSFMYGLLYQDRGRENEAAERFAEACALDRVLQPNLESDFNPS